ncbi:MAG: STAS domain-containing protein [Ignavibacteria bacterium]|nr:STAS domain-containing protein [Ignavibacteria bacterium]
MKNTINTISITKLERYCIVKIDGEIVSLSTSIKLKETLNELIEKDKYYQIILDLSELKFIESSLIGVIVDAYKLLIMINGRMNLIVKAKSVYERFEVSQLDKLLRIYDNLEDAKKSLN